MNFLSCFGFSYCFVQLLSTVVPGAAYFQTTGGGYPFSMPTFGDPEKRNQVNAQTWCTGNQSKLLEIRNEEIQLWTKWFIKYAMDQKHMTGNTIIANGKRTNSDFFWLNGIRVSGITVAGQDASFYHSYAYINVSPSGFQTVADAPTVKRGYICEGSTSSSCSNGFRVSDRCYRSYSDLLSWYDARNRCMDEGGDLGSFDFIANDTGLNALNGSGLNPSYTYWIGLRRQNWTWQDSKSDVKYSQWQEGHPSYPDNYYKECLCLQPYDWKWNECDCNQAYQFICMTGPETSSSSSASSTSSIDVISSTTTTIDTRTPNSSSSPSQSTSTTTLKHSASSLSQSNNSGHSLAIGLGVGIGGGALLIAVILVVVFVIVKRKRCRPNRRPGLQKPPSNPPDVTPESYYATVMKNTEYDDTTVDANGNQVPSSTEYADLSIVTASMSPNDGDQAGRSLV